MAPGVGFVIDPPCRLCHRPSPAAVGSYSLSLVSVRCGWFRFAVVGLDSL